MSKRTLVSFSSGKDSCWAVEVLKDNPEYEIAGLFSTLNNQHNRVSHHSTRARLLELQAESIGLPLRKIDLPFPCPGDRYGEIMSGFVQEIRRDGIECVAFGDLFLPDVREYRETQLRDTGIEAIFPLWQIPTDRLAKQMIEAGVEAYISSVDLRKLPKEFAGKRWSMNLPEGIDPCGENGEIHTIVVDGPMFNQRIEVEIGEVVERDGFAYADIVPTG